MGYDLAIVGAGIIGLAHALAAVRRGKRVVVIDRDARANGASIRNFGFVTVTGQQAGACWQRARRSRDIWAEVAPRAGIEVLHHGLGVVAQREEAEAVAEAFLVTEMGEGCALLTPEAARARLPHLREGAARAVLWSPHELRVESKDAIPRLAAWLAAAHGVAFRWSTAVTGIDLPRIETSGGAIEAEAVVVCPGDDFLTLYSERIAAYGLTKCLLHMLRVVPEAGSRLGAAVMSDLGLARYRGYADLPEAGPLKARLAEEKAEALENGIHLIAVQSADGSLVVGDSHHYGATPPPFAGVRVDDLIMTELDAVLDLPDRRISEHWTGVYASAEDRLMLRDDVSEREKIVIVTSGTGASTGFAIGEETIAGLYD